MKNALKIIAEYNKTEFCIQSLKLLEMIEEKFKEYGFVEKYIENKNDDVAFYKYVLSTLKNAPEVEIYTLNEMQKMLSESNCWYVIYRIGRVIHNVCVELLK